MIEYGTVVSINRNQIKVKFDSLDTEALCDMIQQMTGANKVYVFPAVGDQVACLLSENGRCVVLGSVYSDVDVQPDGAGKNKVIYKIGNTIFEMDGGGDLVVLKTGGAKIEIDADKIDLSNDANSLKNLLKDFASVIKTLKVATPAGPSTNLLPDSVAQLKLLEKKINLLLK